MNPYFAIICNICDLAFIIYIILLFKLLVKIHFDGAAWSFFEVVQLWEDCI